MAQIGVQLQYDSKGDNSCSTNAYSVPLLFTTIPSNSVNEIDPAIQAVALDATGGMGHTSLRFYDHFSTGIEGGSTGTNWAFGASTVRGDMLSGKGWAFYGYALSTNFIGNAAGLTNLSGSFAPRIRTVTAATALTPLDHTINFNGAGIEVPLTLPDAASTTNEVVIKNISVAGSFVLTNTTGGQLIDASLSLTNSTRYKSIHVQSDGTQWWVY